MNITKYAVFPLLCATASLVLADEIPSVTLEIHGPVDAVHAGRLYQRIRGAARQVCEPLDLRDLRAVRAYRRCVDHAVAEAVTQVNSKALTELHLSRVETYP